jgi:N-lysine methyltransferase SETD6
LKGAGELLEEDELLFEIPRNIFLNVENSSLAKHHASLLEELVDDSWLSLVLVMMHEKALGDKSIWKAYFDVLPTEFNTLIWWSEAELAEFQESLVKNMVGKDGADQAFKNRLLPIVQAYPALFGLEHIQTQDALQEAAMHLAHVMASTIMAYGFDVLPEQNQLDEDDQIAGEEGEELPKAMVPLADMLNADGDRNNVSDSLSSHIRFIILTL